MKSALNPEAPEFHPHISTVVQDGYNTVKNTVQSSKQWPAGPSHDLFKTFTDFNIVECQISEYVIEQSNKVLVTELTAVSLKRNDDDNNMDKIIDANDSMLDRVNINIDTESGLNKPNDKFIAGVKQGINVTSWNKNAPTIAMIHMGSTTFIGGKNIPRPQITFKDAIDNSNSLWVPKISDKPNNIKPLALNLMFNDEGMAIGYEHPYQVELDLYQPPAEFIEPDPEPPTFPPPLGDTKLTYIDTESQVDDLVKHLMGVNELAVDVEHHSYRSYQGFTCLIQISTIEGGDFIIDALAMREHLHKLNLIFTDPKKLKVFHGAEMDVVWLQRDLGVYIVGLFDTHRGALALNVKKPSLKCLLMKYCGVNADKKYQLADWRIRPLIYEMLEYARTDTHYLLYIWKRMKGELLAAAAGEPRLLLSCFEQSRQICGSTYKKEVWDESSHLPLYVKSKKSFNSQQMAALQLLYKWRDVQARELDESTGYLLPNHMLVSLAENLPREMQGVHQCCVPMPPFIKQNLVTLHRMILSCRELPLEPQLYRTPPAVRSVDNSRKLSYQVHDLAHLPHYREDEAIDLDCSLKLLNNRTRFQPDVQAFVSTTNAYENKGAIVSDLNVDAKQFIPPYNRYRAYRSLAQIEEIKEFKDKEAKIAAISKGNELIKTEVLEKLTQAKAQVESEEKLKEEDVKVHVKPVKGEKRKRKMSYDKLDRKEAATETKTNEEVNTNTAKTIKPFYYKNANYNKFHDKTNKAHKDPKTKFKKN